MTTITTAPIDFAYEEDTLVEAIATMEREFPGLKIDVVRESGSSAGWPEITLTGEPTFVETVLRTAWASGDDEQDDYLVDCVFGRRKD